jgi:hypothetical protein
MVNAALAETIFYVLVAFGIGFTAGGQIVRYIDKKEAQAARSGKNTFWKPKRTATIIAVVISVIAYFIVTAMVG